MKTTAMIRKPTIISICAARDMAMQKAEEAIHAMLDAQGALKESLSYAQIAHGAAVYLQSDQKRVKPYEHIRSMAGIDRERYLEAYREHLDGRVWMNLLTMTGMTDIMDRQEKDKIYGELQHSVPVVSEETVEATLTHLMANMQVMFTRGLANAFVKLDRRFKSHDGFKLGTRMILTHVFDEWGSFSHRSGMQETLCDIERIFSVLDKVEPGTIRPMTLVNAIQESRAGHLGPRQSELESAYFKIRTFMNGNAHLWFLRDDLVEKANQLLAEFYGAVLPDGVPEDVTAEDIRTKSTAICKDLSFYPTPDRVIERMLSDVDIVPGMRVLEPSAGVGDIVRALLKAGAHVDAIEVDPSRVAALKALPWQRFLNVRHANFLAVKPVPAYQVVVMNPPFYGTHYMQHVMHAFEFLESGGILLSVLPATVEFGETKQHKAFRAWLEKHTEHYCGRVFRDLPAESFASSGTRINTCYVKLRKP